MSTRNVNVTPAEYVIRLFGGVSALARDLEVQRSTIWRWRVPRDKGGSEGQIPRNKQGRLLEMSRARGLDLKAEDLIRGRDVVA
jgi:hypothetical protein